MHSAAVPNHLPNPRITWSGGCLRVAPKLYFNKFIKLPRITMENKSLVAFCTNSNFSIRNEALGRVEPTVGDDDAVIIVDHGSRRQESNLMLNQFVEMFKARTRYRIVEPAHMELAEPSIADAFKACVQKGATRIIVSPFFLFPGRHWQQDIPALAAEAAREHLGISYLVTAPLGLHELLVPIYFLPSLLLQKGATRIIVNRFILFSGRQWQQDIPALAAEAARENMAYPILSQLLFVSMSFWWMS